MQHFILFGAPGSGKGTQAKKLSEFFQLKHLSTGDIIRGEIAADTPLGREAQSVINAGLLLSDDIVVSMIAEALKNNDVKGFIFDGFPRTVVQAEKLEKLLEARGEKVNGVIEIQVPREELVRRMLRRAEIEGRKDDNVETIEKRFEEFRAKTMPVLDYYTQKQLAYSVDGTTGIEPVFEEISKLISKLSL